MQTIYLVGQISPKFPETYQWRKRVVENMKQREDIKVIDPCANWFNQTLLDTRKYAVENGQRQTGLNVIPSKDLTSVLRADIAIVNLNQYDRNKELLGSYFEMAWLYMHPEKTVIAFADNLNSWNCQHPFVTQVVDEWCSTEDEACVIVHSYF